ncbi:MAG TPA: alpha/beta hydrolase [Acidimicrobiales bacterium]|nr:alpha/beta hydrolase [Acidimicrobiales bacterium]
MQTRRIEVAGLGLQVLEGGPPDGRPLLLVHGWGGAKEDFGDHLDALGELGWHAVAPDLRGHGESDKPEGEEAYSLRIFAGDVVGLSKALGWRRFVLVGHSMGGMVAQRVAIDATSHLAGLVLMDTSHGAPDGVEPELAGMAREIVSKGGMELLVEVQREMAGPLDTEAHLRLVETRPGYREFGERKTLNSSPDMWLSMLDEILGQDDRLASLAGVAVPTLVIVGDQDTPFLGQSEAMVGAMPEAHLAVIPDAGHSPQFENPDAWFEVVTSFLYRISTRLDVPVA